jgi:hypothetical protein
VSMRSAPATCSTGCRAGPPIKTVCQKATFTSANNIDHQH